MSPRQDAMTYPAGFSKWSLEKRNAFFAAEAAKFRGRSTNISANCDTFGSKPFDGAGTRAADRPLPLFQPLPAREVTPEPPRPLTRQMPPADAFPVDALGDVLGAAARAIHDRVRAPLAICGQSVLAAAALAVQAHADVQLPMGHIKPVSDYFVTVAETGARKSASDTEAAWPIRKREQALRGIRDAQLPNYVNDKTAWERARDEAMRRGKGNRASIKAALDALGPAPAPPLEPLMTCPEPTFEGLCKLFTVGQPSLGIFATEGGQFVGGHGLSDDAKLRTAAGLSKLWDDGETRRVRAGDGATMLPGRRLTVHLMVQPDVAGIMLNDRLLADQGLLSRFLITAPDSAAGQRLWHEPNPESDAGLKRYGARLLAILEEPFLLASGKANELEPRCLTLSSQARGLWIGFADHVEVAIGPNGSLEPVRGLANKLPEHAARLAAILVLVDDLGAPEISANHMRAGIALAEHYAAEALRLLGASRINSDLRLAQRLLDWLLGTWPEPAIALPDIYQRSLNAISDKAMATKVVAILEDHGWLVRIPEGAFVAGQRRREAWHIMRGA
jgi:Protein of unknown function (DUF3987)